MQVSLKALENMNQKAQSAMARVKKVKAEAQETVNTVVHAVESVSTAFGFGVINGRWQNPEVLGVPVDLGAGLLLHGAGFLVDDGGAHLHALGTGALGSYFSALGVGVGKEMLKQVQAAQYNPSGAPVPQIP